MFLQRKYIHTTLLPCPRAPVISIRGLTKSPCCVEAFVSGPARLPLTHKPIRGKVILSLKMQASSEGLGSSRRKLLELMGGALLGAMLPQGVLAEGSREVGDIPASGILFKDRIKINAFEDPKVKGVEIYITDFERPITERIQKDFFSDPTQASVSCAKTGKVVLSPDVSKSKEGEEVFEQARSLLFKTVRVRRVYDEQTNTLVYVSYSTRLNKEDDANKSRFKTTTCAVHIDD